MQTDSRYAVFVPHCRNGDRYLGCGRGELSVHIGLVLTMETAPAVRINWVHLFCLYFLGSTESDSRCFAQRSRSSASSVVQREAKELGMHGALTWQWGELRRSWLSFIANSRALHIHTGRLWRNRAVGFLWRCTHWRIPALMWSRLVLSRALWGFQFNVLCDRRVSSVSDGQTVF